MKGTGEVISFYVGSFLEHTDYQKCGKKLGTDEASVTAVVDLYRTGATPAEIQLTGKTPLPPKFRVRQELGKSNKAGIFDTFDASMTYAKRRPDTVIEWNGVEHVCCLDVDFPDWYKPTNEQLIAFCDTIKPQPVYYWLSKSRGLHLIYYAKDFYYADELAAVAGYHLSRYYPNASLEFLHRTRYPTNAIHNGAGSTDIDIIRGLLLEYTETDCNAWLAERSLVVGTRYPHTQCPVNPSERAKGNTGPVMVFDDHIFCYICQKDGRTCGSRRAGYFPIAALSGGRINSQIAICVNRFVHWSHAKHVIGGQVANHNLAKRLYSSLLKLKHGDDIRIPMVFEAGEPNGLIRYDGYWCDYLGSVVEVTPTSSILRQLPHCHDILPNGATQINPATCEWLAKTVNQSTRGYYPVTPIRGIQITQCQELPSNRIYNVMQVPELVPDDMAKRRPEFIARELRMPLVEAWGVLESIFPRLDKALIELLIVGRGCMEHRSGLPPMLAIDGPTGVGKTSHVQIAASICGDKSNSVTLKQDRDRFLNGIMAAKRLGGYVVFDEYFKFAKEAKLNDVEAMEELLSFTENSLIYMIHVGSVSLGSLPFFIWSDSKIPETVKAHEQIGRRVYYHNLPSEVSWEQPMNDAGIRSAENLRAYGDDNAIKACNAILSHVIETHFTTPATDFGSVARSLGFNNLWSSDAVADKHQLIKDLFDMVCKAKDIQDKNDKKRFSPDGFKIMNSTGQDALYSCFELCQDEHERHTNKCNKLEECDLQKVLGLKQPTRVEIRSHGLKRAIRFVSITGGITNEKLTGCK